MTDEVDSYEGCDSQAWTSVVTTLAVTCCFSFLLKPWNNLNDDVVVVGTNMWYAIWFHIFWMESIRLAATMLLPQLWHKARGRYPSPRMLAQFNTQLLSLLVSCVLLHNTLNLTLRWRSTPPFLFPDDRTEHIQLTRWVDTSKGKMVVVRLPCSMNNC